MHFGQFFVGVLLDNKVRRLVVKSDGQGIFQHNPYTWQVLGAGFVPAGPTAGRRRPRPRPA